MLQEYSSSLGQVVDIVVSHQGLPYKVALITQLMAALVLPAPEHYRPVLRRFAALGTLVAAYRLTFTLSVDETLHPALPIMLHVRGLPAWQCGEVTRYCYTTRLSGRGAGNGSAEVAGRAQQLLEHSLLSELRAVVARALSGLDMFAGNQLSGTDLCGGTAHFDDGFAEARRLFSQITTHRPHAPTNTTVQNVDCG